MATATAQLASAKLGQDVQTFISDRRAAGCSWNRIALDLYDVTGLVISSESLRLWDKTRASVA